MLRRILLLALPLLILAVGILLARYMLENRREADPDDSMVVEAGQVGDVATVEVLTWTPVEARPEIILYGQLQPARRLEARAAFAGRVGSVNVAPGDPVQAGAVLVRLDTAELERQLARVENRLREVEASERQEHREQAAAEEALAAERELERIAARAVDRIRDLQQRNLAATSDVEEAERALQQQRLARNQQQLRVEGHADRLTQLSVQRREMELDLEQLRADLADAEFTAPFAGEVVGVEVEAGDRVSANTPLLTVIDRSQMRLEARLPLRMAPLLQPQMPARLETEAGEYSLTLQGWETLARGGTLLLRFRLDNPAPLTVADSYHRVRLQLAAEPSVVALPVAALYEQGYVYQVQDDRLQRVDVTLVGYRGSGAHTQALVRSDALPAGAEVLLTRLANAVSGLPVLVRED